MKSGTKNKIKIFEDKKVQTVWDEKAEKWWFSIVDICAALTDSTDPAAYWRRLKQRLLPEGNETVTNCHGLKLKAPDGKMRLTDVADTEGGDGECATSGGTMQNCRVYRTAFSLIDTAISKIKEEISQLTEHRTCLISDVVIGKMDVRSVTVPEYGHAGESVETHDEAEDIPE